MSNSSGLHIYTLNNQGQYSLIVLSFYDVICLCVHIEPPGDLLALVLIKYGGKPTFACWIVGFVAWDGLNQYNVPHAFLDSCHSDCCQLSIIYLLTRETSVFEVSSG